MGRSLHGLEPRPSGRNGRVLSIRHGRSPSSLVEAEDPSHRVVGLKAATVDLQSRASVRVPPAGGDTLCTENAMMTNKQPRGAIFVNAMVAEMAIALGAPTAIAANKVHLPRKCMVCSGGRAPLRTARYARRAECARWILSRKLLNFPSCACFIPIPCGNDKCEKLGRQNMLNDLPSTLIQPFGECFFALTRWAYV
jgi:hypothetical protein